MNKPVSTYYPPRAGAWSGLWYRWSGFRRHLGLPVFHGLGAFGPKQILLSLLIPGFVFLALGCRGLGRGLMLGWVGAGLIFLATLGYSISNVAFGLVVSAHASSLIALVLRGIGRQRFPTRMGLALVLLAGTHFLIYQPALRWMMDHWAMPLRWNGQVIVVRPGHSPRSFHRGDTIVYRLRSWQSGGVLVREGFGIEPILAESGSRVVFYPDRFEIDGQPWPRQVGMPEKGELWVKEKHWFIWPELTIFGEDFHRVDVSGALVANAIVSQDQCVGRPYRHWFGRRQLKP